MPDLKFLKVETTVYIDEDIHSLVDSSPQLVHVQKLSLDLTTKDFDFDFDATERPPTQCLPVHDLLSLFSNLQDLDLRGLGWDQNIFHILPTSLKKLQMHLDLNKVAVTPQTIRQVFLQQNKLLSLEIFKFNVQVDDNFFENRPIRKEWMASLDAL
ncbi:hypothetical protein BT69DRAFT_1289947, partial [Atractiella rhizophila]